MQTMCARGVVRHELRITSVVSFCRLRKSHETRALGALKALKTLNNYGLSALSALSALLSIRPWGHYAIHPGVRDELPQMLTEMTCHEEGKGAASHVHAEHLHWLVGVGVFHLTASRLNVRKGLL